MRTSFTFILSFLAVNSVFAAINISFTSNPVPVSGTNGLDGYIFRFNGVGTGLDAIVTNLSINNATSQSITGAINTSALGGSTENNFVIDLSNQGSIDPKTGLVPPSSGVTSTRMRMQFVNAGSLINSAADILSNLAPAADYVFTFYDIDTVTGRRRVDTITAYGADGYYLEAGGTYVDRNGITQTVSPSKLQVTEDAETGTITARLDPAYTISIAPSQATYIEHAISFLWNNAQQVEFEWSFPYTQKGTRGVEIDGKFPPAVKFANPEFTSVPERSSVSLWLGLTALAFVARRRRFLPYSALL